MEELSEVFPNGAVKRHLHVVVKIPSMCVPTAAADFSHPLPSTYHHNVIHIVSPPIAAIAILLALRTLLPVVLYSPVRPSVSFIV